MGWLISPATHLNHRCFSSNDLGSSEKYEAEIGETIRSALGAESTVVNVKDVSGGCGTSYEITVESKAFEGVSRIARERMVQSPIMGEIKKWYAVTIRTVVPK